MVRMARRKEEGQAINSSTPFTDREFPMTPNNFSRITNLAYECSGIKLTGHKQEMIYSRLVRRLRQLNLNNFNQYCELICEEDSPELTAFINAITTNLTSFFRESHHFDFLQEKLISEILPLHKEDRRVRIWSAGCSTGEEPYSIAIAMQRCLINKDYDIKILATDLDSDVLKKASSGIYGSERLEGMCKQNLHSYFLRNRVNPENTLIKSEIRNYIHFKRLNLLEQWPMKNKFDAIFCRNVVIYFDKETQRTLFDRFADSLLPNGYLFIGHSESLYGVTKRFGLLGNTMYQKIR